MKSTNFPTKIKSFRYNKESNEIEIVDVAKLKGFRIYFPPTERRKEIIQFLKCHNNSFSPDIERRRRGG